MVETWHSKQITDNSAEEPVEEMQQMRDSIRASEQQNEVQRLKNQEQLLCTQALQT